MDETMVFLHCFAYAVVMLPTVIVLFSRAGASLFRKEDADDIEEMSVVTEPFNTGN